MNVAKKTLVVASFFVAAFGAGSASAQGFGYQVGSAIFPGLEPLFKAADVANGAAGGLVEKGVAAGAGAIHPGLGAIVQGGFDMQRKGGFPTVPGFPTAGFPPAPGFPAGSAFPTVPGSFPTQQQIGVFCVNQFGRFGPGAPNIVGASCVAMTPFGPQPGQIG